MSSIFAGLADAKKLLKKTETKGGEVDIARAIKSEPNADNENVVRNYFFAAGVDEWYDNLKEHTFRSEFTKISAVEADVIIRNWNEVTSLSNDPIAYIPECLQGMVNRIDEIITTKFPSADGVFVKLSTRSPKDSKTVFRNATAAFQDMLDKDGNILSNQMKQSEVKPDIKPESEANARLVAFSEEMLKATAVKTGTEAVTLLLDSWRVAEDLMYAFEEGKSEFEVSLVLRAWDSRISPRVEFRGFVWDNTLNCIGQYWHSLYFPHLQDPDLQAVIASDCLKLFEKLKVSLPVPNAMLDLAWLGPGDVILIEVNPLMEGLGSFKGSTGLFDYYEDAPVLTGKVPFEMRIRTEEESMESLISHMSIEWRNVIYGF